MNTNALVRITAAFAIALSYASLNGCATPASPQAMAVSVDASIPQNPRLKNAITVGNIEGGQETNPLWTSQVDNASFREALIASMKSAGYLATDPSSAKYRLDAKLMSLIQPFMGLTLEVKSTVAYTVTAGKAAREHVITANGSGNFSDAVIAIERLKIANERSIKENFIELFRQLMGY
jgi:hypothetical protein